MTAAARVRALSRTRSTQHPLTGSARPAWRAVVGLLLLTLALLAGTATNVLNSAAPAHAVPPTEITLEDTAGIIYEPQLREQVGQIQFREPTHVVVFTQFGTADSNFNERVLAFARERHPEWISPDGQKWADGLYLVAIDPEGRHVGTYFGEDRKVSPETRDDIQESMGDLLLEAQWTDAAVKGVKEGAQVINRPWYLNPALLWTGVIWGGIALFWAAVFQVAMVRERRKTREALAAAQSSFSAVSLELEATELHARTVPADSRYGAMLLERHRGFQEQYVKLAAENDRLRELSRRELTAKENRSAVQSFLRRATELDRLDDSVAAASTFLNLQHGWEAAWDLQTGPLRDDLRHLDSIDGVAPSDRAALESFRVEAEAELERIGAALSARSITPDDALDRLAAQRARLTELLDRAAEQSSREFSKGTKDQKSAQKAFRGSRRDIAHRPTGSILDSVHEPGYFWTVGAYRAGRRSGKRAVAAAQRSRRSRSSTGYGRSGGSFSGSGSSSRF